MKNLGRRDLIKLLGVGVGSTVLGAGVARASVAGGATSGPRRLPWAYAALDPDAAGQRGFDSYAKGHCMYGTFDALVGPTAERLGAPYTDFPFEMLAYGAGGVQGWGTLCGALNGSAAAFQLLSPKPEPLVDALFSWYEREALPNVLPKGTKFPNVPAVAGSPLCHASIAAWCKKTGKKAFSAERKERCGVLTAAVARQAAVLLNAQLASKPVDAALAKGTQECMSCHEKGGELENARAKMSCGGCHFALGTKHKDL